MMEITMPYDMSRDEFGTYVVIPPRYEKIDPTDRKSVEIDEKCRCDVRDGFYRVKNCIEKPINGWLHICDGIYFVRHVCGLGDRGYPIKHKINFEIGCHEYLPR